MKGKFIVIEGIDGCGKSSQVELLKKSLFDYRFYFTREATDGPIGKLLRNEYLTGNRKCDEHIINLMYAADRLDHITNSDNGILKYLEEGINVISDRYYLSSMAYNSYMKDTKDDVMNEIKYTISLNKYNMELLRPDLTIYIDLDPNESLRRLTERCNSVKEDPSVYETTEKLLRIHKAYDLAIYMLRDMYKENIVIINGNRSIEDIHEDIHNKIMDKIWE